MGIKTVLHPPYSPDIDPFNFLLFPKLKKNRRWESFWRQWENEGGCKKGPGHLHFRWFPWRRDLHEEASALQVHWSQKILFWRILQFCTYLKLINVSPEKVRKLLNALRISVRENIYYPNVVYRLDRVGHCAARCHKSTLFSTSLLLYWGIVILCFFPSVLVTDDKKNWEYSWRFVFFEKKNVDETSKRF